MKPRVRPGVRAVLSSATTALLGALCLMSCVWALREQGALRGRLAAGAIITVRWQHHASTDVPAHQARAAEVRLQGRGGGLAKVLRLRAELLEDAHP